MNKWGGLLVAVIVGLAVLVSAGPVLVELMQQAVPLAAVVGVVAVMLRLAWYYTNRY